MPPSLTCDYLLQGPSESFIFFRFSKRNGLPILLALDLMVKGSKGEPFSHSAASSLFTDLQGTIFSWVGHLSVECGLNFSAVSMAGLGCHSRKQFRVILAKKKKSITRKIWGSRFNWEGGIEDQS